MKRVLVGGMSHESNSFNPIIACEKDFSVIRGKDLFNVTNRRNSFSGAVNTLQETMAYEDQPEKAALCAQSLDEIVNTALEEAEIESLVIAKGYTDCVTYISDDVVSVAVSAPAEGLKENDVALISDVVTSQTDFKLSDVRIIEVK